MEIEKKYLVDSSRMTEWLSHAFRISNIEQYYLNDINDQWLIRLRSYGESYLLTLKGKGMLSREELEFTIDKSSFEKSVVHSKKSLKKKRYDLQMKEYPNLILQVDVYEKYSFITCEVEFETEKEANSFRPPVWCYKDITEDERYKNVNLAK